MIAAYGSLAVLLLAALLVGQALYVLSRGGGSSRLSPLAAPLGIATLLVACGVASRLPGDGVTIAVAAVASVAAAAGYLRKRVDRTGIDRAAALAIPVLVVTIAAASLPFAVAGNVGILGAGLLNDDMASHLLIADYVQDSSGEKPSFVRSGYPTGPHAVVVALQESLGVGAVEAFAALSLALAALTGLLALGLLRGLESRRRVGGACLIALSYLGAAYLSQGAFKEPLQALLLIGFAIILGDLIGLRSGGVVASGTSSHPLLRAMPLGALAAASVFNYSLPGLLWIGAVAGAVLGARFLVQPRPALDREALRRLAPYAAGAFAVIVVATIPEWSRISDFARLDALNPDRFGSDLGNLKQSISPLESLGIWPVGDYRTTASAAGLPAPLFYLGGALALAAVLLGARRALQERDSLPLLAALLAIAAVWIVTALFSTPYIAAKALAIAAPAAMAVALAGVLSPRDRTSPQNVRRSAVTWLVPVLGLAFAAAATLSSFLVLRQAPVGPEAHAAELATVREAVAGEPVLFLGRDNFIGWELAGSGPITGVVTNFYSVEEVRGRFQKGSGGGEKFDVDAVFPETLDSFRFILSSRGGPQSSPPPRFVPLIETDSYVLWERRGQTGRRRTLDEGVEPGAVLDCEDETLRREVASGKGTAVVWETEPVIGNEEQWQPSASATDTVPASLQLRLSPGRWLISLAYDSRRPVRVSAPELGLDTEIVANLDFRGPSPYFPVAEVAVDQAGPIDFEVTVEEPNAIANLLRAPNEAHLRQLSATPLETIERIPRRRACGEYVDWYR